MTLYGYFLSSEEYGPRELVEQAQQAEAAGFEGLWISDHYHPWNEEQGESPFVWSVIGAIANATTLPITTAVTCPIIRIHPAILAQAAATSAVLTGGRFFFGVGTGENLNEHVLGDRWPPAEVRLDMLAEAVEVMRKLWTGEVVNHHGDHYTVENARLYTLPDHAPPILISAFGPRSAEVAGQIGDGYVGTSPDPHLIRVYHDAGGTGSRSAGVKMCWGDDERVCRRRAHQVWRTSGIPGDASQELPMPTHFEQAADLVGEDDIARKISCGPDTYRHVDNIRSFEQAGYDQVYVAQVGGASQSFFRFAADELLPRLHDGQDA